MNQKISYRTTSACEVPMACGVSHILLSSSNPVNCLPAFRKPFPRVPPPSGFDASLDDSNSTWQRVLPLRSWLFLSLSHSIIFEEKKSGKTMLLEPFSFLNNFIFTIRQRRSHHSKQYLSNVSRILHFPASISKSDPTASKPHPVPCIYIFSMDPP